MRTVFFDIDTQLDFLAPAGALYAKGAENVLPAVARLNHWAAAHGVPLISTMDAHSENDPEFAAWKPHCVTGTDGQRKPAATLVAGQHFVRKQDVDCFTSPELPPLLAQFQPERCIVYGLVTDVCVRLAAEGLLARGCAVEIVEDAVKEFDVQTAKDFLRRFLESGGRLTTSSRIAA